MINVVLRISKYIFHVKAIIHSFKCLCHFVSYLYPYVPNTLDECHGWFHLYGFSCFERNANEMKAGFKNKCILVLI